LTSSTEASTPFSALTVTGLSTATPTAPSVTEVVTLGTSRSPNGVALSMMALGAGAPRLPLQAPAPNTASGTISTARYR
jgi:hypothetical protein